MRKVFKNNKAITLIVLVVTIVILIILASVAITMSLSNTGIFSRVKQAKVDYQTATNEEEMLTSSLSNDISSASSLNSNRNENISDIRENLICEYNMTNVVDNVIKDSSGNNRDAVAVGTGYQIKEENGKKYLSLDGTAYFENDDFASLKQNAEKTILCCFRTTDLGSAPYIIGLGDDDERNGGFPVRTYAGYPYFATGYNVYLYNGQVKFTSDNTWHFVCLTFDSKTTVFYVDDKVLYASNTNLSMQNSKLTIGAHKTGRAKYSGDISDIRVYDKGFNYNQVYNIYKALKR